MIEVREVSKTLNGYRAVDNVSFKVRKGERFGILGPNGAGKTTLISMLSTALKPDSGSIRIFGLDTVEDCIEIRKSVGVIFQECSLDDRLTAAENLWISSSLYKVPSEVRKQKIEESLKLVGLREWKDKIVRRFSWGMKRRLEIARAILADPKLLLMDEPTLGLDPRARSELWDYLTALDVTMVLTTNYTEEAEKLCTRVALMDNGRMIALDSPENLKKTIKGDVIVLRCESPEKLASKLLEDYPDLKIVGEKIIITSREGEKTVSHIAKKVKKELKSIEVRPPTLNDVFLQLTGREIRGPGELR
jgi:ABC-2 type transport system ATP-binding protein